MAMFVHLTSEKNIKSILRNGISRLRRKTSSPSGVFAMPVTRNFYVSHQWLRELKRRGSTTVAGIYFRIPDEESVWVGHYSQAHQQMSAADAIALMMAAENREGFEVIIPRRIGRNEIHKVKTLPQITGWRYYPEAHGKRPCGCPFCQRGLYGARRLREEYEKQFTAIQVEYSENPEADL
ncbi:MAG: hypothetical protein U0Z53_16220 [Blastocatellia bacterium]